MQQIPGQGCFTQWKHTVTLYVMQLSEWQNTVKSFQAHSHVKWFKSSKISETDSISIWWWRWSLLICQQHWVVHGGCVYWIRFFWSAFHSFLTFNQLLFSQHYIMTGNSSKYEKLGEYISKWANASLKTLTINVGRCSKWPVWPRDTCHINLENIGHELPELDFSLNSVLLWSLLHLGFCCNLVHETCDLKRDKIHLSHFI